MKKAGIDIDELLSRGVGSFIDPEGVFKKKLLDNPEKVVIKFGIDPTRADIHLGHAVILRKLRQFQDLGCKVIFLVGDFTAMIGDPTGKSKIRPELDQREMINIVNTYITQIPKILKIEPITDHDKKISEGKIVRDENNFIVDSPWFGWMRNADWFQSVTDITTEGATMAGLILQDPTTGQQVTVESNTFVGKAVLYENTRLQKAYFKNQIKSVSFINILSVLRHITHSQLIERDMFQERIKKNEPLYMHEMLYPVLQGIDSGAITDIYGSCDLEVGGTDQTFNMLMGRKVMEMGKRVEPQAVLSFKLLEGLDGKEKMSKSLDNYIGITFEPGDMYGKVMSIPDNLIVSYFELCTYTPQKRVEEIKKELEDGKINPKDIKMELARQIVAIYHSEAAVKLAEDDFNIKFPNKSQKKEIPDEVDEIVLEERQKLVDALVEKGVVSSKTDWRRLVDEGAVTDLSTGEKVTNTDYAPEKNTILKIGKKRFVKIV